MLADLLNLTGVQIVKSLMTDDGMGGAATTSSVTTISKCAIFQNSSNKSFLSDQFQQNHRTFCIIPSAYSWTKG